MTCATPHSADTGFLSYTRYRQSVLFGQFAASSVPVDEQSVLPKLRGLPWWGAVLLALGLTALGAAIDAKLHGALRVTYQICYLAGCVLAALAVRRRGLFTTAVQPPLIAFAVGIVALYAINASANMSAKTLIFKVALPIATSFPSMAVTFLLTLAVVVGRWFITRDTTPAKPLARTTAAARRPDATKSRRPAERPAERTRAARSPASKESGAQPARRPRPADTSSSATRTRRRVSDDQATQRVAQPRVAPSRTQAPPRTQAQPRPQRPEGPDTAARRTAGAAARAAGIDLTLDVPDDRPARRRPRPPAE